MKNTGLLYESVRYLGESLVPETTNNAQAHHGFMRETVGFKALRGEK